MARFMFPRCACCAPAHAKRIAPKAKRKASNPNAVRYTPLGLSEHSKRIEERNLCGVCLLLECFRAFSRAVVLGEPPPPHWRQPFRTLCDVEGEFLKCDTLLPTDKLNRAFKNRILPVVLHRRQGYRLFHHPSGGVHLIFKATKPGQSAILRENKKL